MDIYVRNDEGMVGRHHKRCVCRIHIQAYIGTGIMESVMPPMPITQDDPEFESEWEAHKEEINGLREQVTDQMDEMDEQKRKIFALEKLLKLYLP